MSASPQTERMPVLFVSHGAGPCWFMEDDGVFAPMNSKSECANDFRQLPKRCVPQTPTAILVVSAHYISAHASTVEVSARARHSLLFDYYGFPAHTYELDYPAPGSPWLSSRVQQLLSDSAELRALGVTCAPNAHRGLDHGAFLPLKMMYPEAEVPVVNMSLLPSLQPDAHCAVGRALQPLREQGVLIVASGQATHAFDPESADASRVFDRWLTDVVTSDDSTQRRERLCAFQRECPAWRGCHSPPDHLLPMMVAVGAAGADRGRCVLKFWPLSFMSIGHFVFQ